MYFVRATKFIDIIKTVATILQFLHFSNCFRFYTRAMIPETVMNALENLEPQTVAGYLQGTASEFHKFYSEHRVVTNDKELTMARLFLASAVRTVLANGLEILGISQPEKM